MAHRGTNNYNGRINSNGDTINSATSQSYRGRTQEPRDTRVSDSLTQRKPTSSHVVVNTTNTTIAGAPNITFESLSQINEWLVGSYNRQDNIMPDDVKLGHLFLIKDTESSEYWVSEIPLKPFDLDTKTSPTFNPIKGAQQPVEIEGYFDKTHIGIDPPPEDYNIWIDTNGLPSQASQTVEHTAEQTSSGHDALMESLSFGEINFIRRN